MSSITSQPLSTTLQMEPVSNVSETTGEMGPTWSNVGSPKPLIPSKRKPTTEPLLLQTSNKRVVHTDKKHQDFPNKRMTRNDSMSSKTVSPRVQTSKTKILPPEVSPKVQSESIVRAKMRETLAAALSVGNHQNSNELCNEDKNGPQGGSVGLGSGSQPASNPPPGEADVDTKETKESEVAQKPQYNYVMPDTDGSFGDTFFVKDELLQGNGLSWAWDMDVGELKEVQTDGKPNSISTEQGQENKNGVEQVLESPQELAFKIESELFKLFGGVNKKYKEKGRSLMFNLKDRNNPELREKVLSAKISPERLCSMTPEELASKELSEWRMAKAEELDKMIVLPDSDGDMRRLVKKTHKGEYQVEVEQDDGVSVEVAVGSTSLAQFQPKKKKSQEVKETVEGESGNTSNRVTVSTDGPDFMQELIVEEFKDEGFLPPIVSLDEFMESLDTEPPFENLTVDGNETKAIKKESGDSEKVSFGGSFVNSVAAELGAQKPLELSSVKGRESFVERKAIAVGECLWEGDLQLTISSTVSVLGLFRSGEKTSTKDWPGSVEIKGRVRLEAFEKFLQELPMSRSRAVMVVHFILKDDSSEFHRASLSESVESYVAEERVGFGEPNPGTEVYFCPPNKRITDMLCRLLSKDQTDIVKSTDNGLTGVVVWRRPQPAAATLPPNSSSQLKHHRKHFPSRRQETINTNTNSKQMLPMPPPPPDSGGDDDDGDIPPGFGPGVVAREEDDLPEFSFSGGSNSNLSGQQQSGQRVMVQSSPTPRPVAHMRQLVYEYGQTGNNNNQLWNGNRGSWNREEDDIPEWQPQPPPQPPFHHRPELQNHVHFNQVRPVMGPNVVLPVMPVRPTPPNLMQNVWMQPPPPPHGLPPNAAVQGRHYGGQWRPEEPRGRGF